MNTYPVTLEVPVAWGDLDAFGHVNNTVYFRWFESARMAYFERVGLPVDRPEAVGPILATTTCNFLAPVRYPATLAVSARVPRVGNSSFTMEYEVTEGERPVAHGSGVLVLVDYSLGDKVPIPDDVRAAIAALG